MAQEAVSFEDWLVGRTEVRDSGGNKACHSAKPTWRELLFWDSVPLHPSLICRDSCKKPGHAMTYSISGRDPQFNFTEL